VGNQSFGSKTSLPYAVQSWLQISLHIGLSWFYGQRVTIHWLFVASVMMLIGWGTLAVPTGIFSAELTARRVPATTRICPECLKEGLPPEDNFCGNCGIRLPAYQHD
jgi:hypothetical protein